MLVDHSEKTLLIFGLRPVLAEANSESERFLVVEGHTHEVDDSYPREVLEDLLALKPKALLPRPPPLEVLPPTLCIVEQHSLLSVLDPIRGIPDREEASVPLIEDDMQVRIESQADVEELPDTV